MIIFHGSPYMLESNRPVYVESVDHDDQTAAKIRAFVDNANGDVVIERLVARNGGDFYSSDTVRLHAGMAKEFCEKLFLMAGGTKE